MFRLRVVHISNKVLYEGLVEGVSLPGVSGEFEVNDLHGHLVSLLGGGVITVRPGEHTVAIEQGLVRFDGERLMAVVE